MNPRSERPIHSPPGPRPEVSVVIPVFGARHAASLPAVVDAWLTQDVANEVVIAHTGPVPTIAHRPRVTITEAPITEPGPGLLRNHGVQAARGRMLYLTDADVAPLGTDFLRRAVHLARGGALAQPWMYRLLTSTLLRHATAIRAPAPPGRYCFVTTTGQGRLHPVADDVVTWRKRPGADGTPRHIPYAPVPAGAPQGLSGHRPVRAVLHWGGLLISRTAFQLVGQYCRLYRGWGCEDDDLLVKVAAISKLTYAAITAPSLACVHVEHDYPHTGTTEHNANRYLLRTRRCHGPQEMITTDRDAMP